MAGDHQQAANPATPQSFRRPNSGINLATMFVSLFALSAVLIAVLVRALHHPVEQYAQSLIPKNGTDQNILLLTAHPDDECMFFGPTLTSLVQATPVLGHQPYGSEYNDPIKVFSLCLSIGGADGLGNVRKEEFERSLDVLGVDKSRRWLVDHP